MVVPPFEVGFIVLLEKVAVNTKYRTNLIRTMQKQWLTLNAIHVDTSPPTYRNTSPSCECVVVGDEADQVLQVNRDRVCIDP